jgi:hypothetical protein
VNPRLAPTLDTLFIAFANSALGSIYFIRLACQWGVVFVNFLSLILIFFCLSIKWIKRSEEQHGKRFLLLGCLPFGWYSALWSLSEYEWAYLWKHQRFGLIESWSIVAITNVIPVFAQRRILMLRATDWELIFPLHTTFISFYFRRRRQIQRPHDRLLRPMYQNQPTRFVLWNGPHQLSYRHYKVQKN